MEKRLMGGNLPSLALIQGTVRHIQWTPREIEVYITCLEKVIRRYVQRLQWLLTGEPACCPGGRRGSRGSGSQPRAPQASHS